MSRYMSFNDYYIFFLKYKGRFCGLGISPYKGDDLFLLYFMKAFAKAIQISVSAQYFLSSIFSTYLYIVYKMTFTVLIFPTVALRVHRKTTA